MADCIQQQGPEEELQESHSHTETLRCGRSLYSGGKQEGVGGGGECAELEANVSDASCVLECCVLFFLQFPVSFR